MAGSCWPPSEGLEYANSSRFYSHTKTRGRVIRQLAYADRCHGITESSVSMADLGEKIAEGREAEIYSWRPGGRDAEVPQVLKLFFGDRSLGHANRELAISAAVKAAGAPTPAVFGDVVEHGGRYGIVYERVYGTDMLNILSTRPWKTGTLGRELGVIHARIHQARPAGLPPLKDALERKIADARELTESEKSRVLSLLADLPDGDRPYHGDLHPGNIIVREDGQPVIIDWANAAAGDPMADVARSQLLMTVGWRAAPQRVTRLLGRWFSAWLLREYLKSYFAASGADPAGVARWQTVIAAARLGEYIPAETKHVAMLVRSGLAQA